jgi:hypothetical protein
MKRLFVVWLAALALCSCDQAPNGPDALGTIEQACLQKAELRFSDFQASADQSVAQMCNCARDRLGDQFSDNELDVIARLERTTVEMGRTSVDDFQALELLRLQYNGALDSLADRTRGRLVAEASRNAVSSCQAPR